MGTRVTPSERLRYELDSLIDDAGELQDPIEEIGRLGARLIIQQALEDELTEFLGRRRYERAGELVAHRKGYERSPKIATTSGRMEIERPRVRDASKLGFESRIVGKGIARTYALETLVICSFLRGLSVRDVEASLEETFDQPVISKSTVSRVLEDTRERYRRWCKRKLDEHDLVYLFLDPSWTITHPDLPSSRHCSTQNPQRFRSAACSPSRQRGSGRWDRSLAVWLGVRQPRSDRSCCASIEQQR